MSSSALLLHHQCAVGAQVSARRGSRAGRVAPIRAQQQQHRQADTPARSRVAVATAKLGGALAAAAAAVLVSAGGAWANAEKIAEFPTSGFIFKDSVTIVQLDDPQVEGVAIYLTDYQRSLTERLAKDPFSDPSQASLTCLTTQGVTIKDLKEVQGSEGKEIFSERKGLNLFQNKNLRVRRIYDEKNKSLLYVAYSTRFTGASEEKSVSTSRYRTSVCAVPLAVTAPVMPMPAPPPGSTAPPPLVPLAAQ